MLDTVAAVIVTYNRKELLAECILALLNQTHPLNKIFVIDNASTDGTYIMLERKGFLNNSKISYHALPENMGSSGGFAEGIKKAHEEGFDWIWIMDDDSEPAPNALELLLEYSKEENVAAIANLEVNPQGKVVWSHRGNFSFNNFICTTRKNIV